MHEHSVRFVTGAVTQAGGRSESPRGGADGMTHEGVAIVRA